MQIHPFLLGQFVPNDSTLPMTPPPVKFDSVMDQFKITPDMKFSKAARVWLDSIVKRSENTTRSYQMYVNALCLLFGDMKLSEIRLDHLSVYQKLRIKGEAPFVRYRRPQDAMSRKVKGVIIPPKGKTPCPAQAKKVNQELAVLIRILKRAGLWEDKFYDIFQQLPEEIAEIPRALAPEDQRRWLETAMSNPRWHVVYWYSQLAFDTCMSTNEIRALRLQDINLPMRTITVPVEGAKNKFRHRTISHMSTEAFSAILCLMERAAKMGSREPHHYLFPLKVGYRGYDPAQPMTASGIKILWNEVRVASKLEWFRPYDTRHTAITRLAEAGVPMGVIMRRAGHISPQMTDHYTHLSEAFVTQELQRAGQVYTSRAYGRQTPTASTYWHQR